MILGSYKNFIPTDLLQTIHNELRTNHQWVYRNAFWRYYLIEGLNPYVESNEHSWYGNQKDILNLDLKKHWLELFESIFKLAGPNFVLQRYALTGQTQGQEQPMHVDTSVELPGDFRSYLVYLNTEWDISWGGLTELQLNENTVHYEVPEPGKLVVFDSKIMHRGQSPSKPNLLRLSLVLHGKHV
jgi:hypothetical protein